MCSADIGEGTSSFKIVPSCAPCPPSQVCPTPLQAARTLYSLSSCGTEQQWNGYRLPSCLVSKLRLLVWARNSGDSSYPADGANAFHWRTVLRFNLIFWLIFSASQYSNDDVGFASCTPWRNCGLLECAGGAQFRTRIVKVELTCCCLNNAKCRRCWPRTQGCPDRPRRPVRGLRRQQRLQ